MTDQNPFDDDQDQEDNSTIEAIRKAARAKERALKEAEKELEELRSWREQVQKETLTNKVTAAFQEAGLPDKLAGLYLKANPDVTPDTVNKDAVRSFAAEYGIAPPPVENFEADRVTKEEPQQFEAPAVPGAGGSRNWEPVTSAQLAEAARRGDTAALVEAAQRELQQPGYINYKYPGLVEE